MTASDDVDMEAIAERCEQLRTSIEATKSEYEKEKMQVRQAYHLVHLVHLVHQLAAPRAAGLESGLGQKVGQRAPAAARGRRGRRRTHASADHGP